MKIFLEIKKKEKKQTKTQKLHDALLMHFWCSFDAVSFFPKNCFFKIY